MLGVMTFFPCSKCDGAGEVPLPPALEKTLAAFGRARGSFSAQQIRERRAALLGPDCTVNNVSNHLARLDDIGLIEFVGKNGRHKLYRRVS